VLDDTRFHLATSIPSGVPADSDHVRTMAGSLRSVAYSELTELRVRVGRGAAALTAKARTGESWSVPLQAADLARVQQALDRVDVRLASPSFRSTNPTVVRYAALGAMIAAGFGGNVSLGLVALLTAWLPGSATLFGLSVALIVSALLDWRDIVSLRPWQTPAAIGLCAVLGLIGAAGSLRGWGEPRPGQRITLVATILGSLTGVAWLVCAFATTENLYWAHNLARGHFSTVLPLTLAAVLLTQGRRSAHGAQAIAALTLVPLLAGSDWFATEVVRDPLLKGDEIPLHDARLEDVAREPIRFVGDVVRLSPSGRRFLVPAEPDGEGQHVVFAAGAFGSGHVEEFTANMATFAGEDHLLMVTSGLDRSQVRLKRLPGGGDEWSLDLPKLAEPVGTVDSGRAMWFVTGREGTRLRRFTGTLAGERTGEMAWRLPETAGSLVRWHVGPGSHALVVEQRMRTTPLSFATIPWAMDWIYEATIWHVAADSEPLKLLDSNASVECADVASVAGQFVCSAGVSGRYFFWSIDPVTGQTRPLGFVRADYMARQISETSATAMSSLGQVVLFFNGSTPIGYRVPFQDGWILGTDGDARMITATWGEVPTLKLSSLIRSSHSTPRRE
jgi:hypothetical protein